jgi:hypothetical protein
MIELTTYHERTIAEMNASALIRYSKPVRRDEQTGMVHGPTQPLQPQFRARLHRAALGRHERLDLPVARGAGRMARTETCRSKRVRNAANRRLSIASAWSTLAAAGSLRSRERSMMRESRRRRWQPLGAVDGACRPGPLDSAGASSDHEKS